MKNYNELSKEWSEQQPSRNSLPDRAEQIKKKQVYTIAVLAVTVLILVAYMIYVYSPEAPVFNFGLGLMIGSVVVRIVFEIQSVLRLQNQRPDLSVLEYHEELKSYFKHRLKVHQFATPAILVTYWTGFILLIPTFKLYLSEFWFQYICWSSIPIAAVMNWFIAYQIRKEKRELIALQEEFE